MAEYAECYVLLRTRSKQLGLDFLDHFLPGRVSTRSLHEVPFTISEPTISEFDTAEEVMDYLEENKNDWHPLHWRTTDPKKPNIIGRLTYTLDGCLVFGMSYDLYTYTTNEIVEAFKAQKAWLKSDFGYIINEQPAEMDYKTFEQQVKQFRSIYPKY